MGFLFVIVLLTFLIGNYAIDRTTPKVTIVSDGPSEGTDANLACLWDPRDIADSEDVIVRWYINGKLTKEAESRGSDISGLDAPDPWSPYLDFKDAGQDEKVKTEGRGSVKLEFNNTFADEGYDGVVGRGDNAIPLKVQSSDDARYGFIGRGPHVPPVLINTTDDVVYTLDIFVEDPSVIRSVELRICNRNDTPFVWKLKMPRKGKPLHSGWNSNTFWGKNRLSDKDGVVTTQFPAYYFLVENYDVDFHQTLRFDNFLKYTGVVLEASQTFVGDEIVCEVTPSLGKNAGMGVTSSIFTVKDVP